MSVKKPESLFRKRIQKFKTLKRGYYSFWLLIIVYGISFFFPFLLNNKAICVKYQDEYYFPALADFANKIYLGSDFGLDFDYEPSYRYLQLKFEKEDKGNWVWMPLHPYGPREQLIYPELEASLDPDAASVTSIAGHAPHPPSWEHPMGTDASARDVMSRLAWGFNISISFALIVTLVNYLVGISIGACLGYFAGKVDILGQRLIEIWSAVPFLYFMMIVSTLFVPTETFQAFWVLVLVISMFGWMGMTYFIRGEFYREKAKDYVAAAISQGESHTTIVFKHILPNSLTPVITFAPFAVVGAISSLVALDFLGFGLPAGSPSWGEMVKQGTEFIREHKWWLAFYPLLAMFLTLTAVVFIGEAIREAFDPKVFSRLR